MSTFFEIFISGIVVGILFGFVLQRGRFCMNSAFRDIVVLKEYSLLKSVMVALLTCMIGFGILSLAGIITFNPKPFTLFGSIIGGFIFGMGMVLAAGCASGTTYRVGEGMMGSFVALLGLAIGALATAAGVLSGPKTALQSYNFGPIMVFGTLTPIFTLIIGVIGFALVLYKWILPAIKEDKGKGEESGLITKIFKKGWPWYTTGIVIGIVNVIAWPLSFAAGRNYPLGITAGWLGNLKYLITGDPTVLNWLTWMVIGVVLGGLIASLIAGEFKLRTPKDGKILLYQFVGGFLMGFGAVVAMGCNIGNLLSGIPQWSVGSIVVAAGIILGTWLMAYILFMRE
ncbi:MAG: YeeE/YedE family protein [Promethearchaeota archaeon]